MPGMKIRILSRRRFIGASAMIGGAALVGPAFPMAQGASARRWPVSCRDPLLKIAGQGGWAEAMAALGVRALEVDVNEKLECPALATPAGPHRLDTDDAVRRLQADLKERGVGITAFCLHNRLDERLEQEIAWTRRVAEASQQLGIDVIRIDVVPRKVAVDEFLPFAIQACRKLCEAVEATGVRLGLENHGRITNDPAFLDRLFDGVGSSRLGLTLDAANFYWFGHPLDEVYRIIEKFAPRAFHTHCKNIAYPEDRRQTRRPMGWEYGKCSAPVPEGDIDFGRVVRLLREAGYRGDLCLENECVGRFPAGEQAGLLRREIEALKRLARG